MNETQKTPKTIPASYKKTPKKSFFDYHPDLLKEYCTDLNTDIGDIKKIYKTDKRKAFWKCSVCHHVWKTSFIVRDNNRNCPACAGRQVSKGINDLATLCPNLLKEWDYEKNTIDPSTITKGSKYYAHWKDSLGHEWQAYVYSRTAGHGCPYCSKIRPLPGINDVQTLCPDLISEWNDIKDPRNYMPGSPVKINWKCSKNHTWTASISSRAIHNHKCPYCAGVRFVPGKTDLYAQFPELVNNEWDFNLNTISPSKISASSRTKVFWKCSKGHSYQTSIASKTYKKTKCPICNNKKVLPGFNDFLSQYPELAKEWDYTNSVKPDEIVCNYTKKVKWICSKNSNHQWSAKVTNRIRGNGCPYCTNHKLISGENDLATLYPELISEWHYEKNHLPPEQVSPFTKVKYWWKCSKCGGEWEASPKKRIAGTGCPYDAGIRALSGVTDFATKYPQYLPWIYTADIDASTILPRSKKIITWKCGKCSSIYSASFDTFTHNVYHGCPVCSKQKKAIGKIT